MMPTFPSSALKLRTADFPQTGFEVSFDSARCELLLIARLCAVVDWDEEYETELVQGIGSLIKRFTAKNALRAVF